MHIYGFGSVCRGEIYPDSDVDLLLIGEPSRRHADPNVYSIYSYERIKELWCQGNPFAWHLSLEARLLFASDGEDHLQLLGRPKPYRDCIQDCANFFKLFNEARVSLETDSNCKVFDLSTIFLSMRNIATCFSLGMTQRPDFSRHSAIRLEAEERVPLSSHVYEVLERARVLSTRGLGSPITIQEVAAVINELDELHTWMTKLVGRAKS